MSLFCRHNRFTADCPICSAGTSTDGDAGAPRRRPSSSRRSAPRKQPAAPVFKGPHSGAGPYTDADGSSYAVRLEKVPGGVRLAEWEGTRLRQRAPILDLDDLASLLRGTRGVLADRDAAVLESAAAARPEPGAPARESITGVSKGRSGELKEELRVQALDGGRIRIARWIFRPGAGAAWELQDAAPMLPAKRFAQAVADAVRQGLELAPSTAAQPRL